MSEAIVSIYSNKTSMLQGYKDFKEVLQQVPGVKFRRSELRITHENDCYLFLTAENIIRLKGRKIKKIIIEEAISFADFEALQDILPNMLYK